MKPFYLIALIFLISCKKTAFESFSEPESLHTRAVGASAKELISNSRYNSLKVEVQYMAGFAPDPAALNHLEGFLSAYLNKPGGVTIFTKKIDPNTKGSMDAGAIIHLENEYRSVFSSGNELAVYVLYTNGDYKDNKVLGLAYRNTSIAIFGNTVHENSGGIGQPARTKLEATILEHEFAHLMGLVDLGTPMQNAHKDEANGNHCTNRNCLMYYTAETTDVLGILLTGNVPSLDGHCLADIRANGGK